VGAHAALAEPLDELLRPIEANVDTSRLAPCAPQVGQLTSPTAELVRASFSNLSRHVGH